MLKGIDVNEVVEFVSSQDKSDNPTVFLIRNITMRSKMSLFKGAIDKQGQVDITVLQERAIDIFKAGIKGIKNLGGKDYDAIDDALIDSIPMVTMIEVVGKILECNFASESETKN